MRATARTTANRHLRIADPAEILRQDITTVCDQIDRRLNNRPGTAERAVYFWWWPPDSVADADVLTELHRDAVAALAAIVTNHRHRTRK